MNVSGVSSTVATALSAAKTEDDYSMAMAGKAMDAQKQEGAAALDLIASATGKGKHVNALA